MANLSDVAGLTEVAEVGIKAVVVVVECNPVVAVVTGKQDLQSYISEKLLTFPHLLIFSAGGAAAALASKEAASMVLAKSAISTVDQAAIRVGMAVVHQEVVRQVVLQAVAPVVVVMITIGIPNEQDIELPLAGYSIACFLHVEH